MKYQKVETIIDLINKTLRNPNKKFFVDFKKVSKKEISKISELLEKEIKLEYHSLSSDEIIHIKNRHPNITDTDFCLIPEIIKNPDNIELGDSNTHKGLETIIYSKTIGFQYFIVEEVRTGRKKLAVLTLYKNKIK